MAVKACRALSCKTDDGEAIGAVRCYLKFHRRIAHAENIAYVVTRGKGSAIEIFVIEYENAVCSGKGHIVSGEPQLFDRAEHTLGNNAAELACLYLNAVCELGYSFLSLGGDGNGNISALENIFAAVTI